MEERYKNIESYLGNNMSPEDLERFETMMEEDAGLKEEVLLYEKLNFHLKQDFPYKGNVPETSVVKELRTYLKSNEAQVLRENIKQYSNAYKSQNKKNPSRKYRMVAALIVVLILGAITIQLLNKKTPEQLYASYYKQADLPPLIKRDNNKLDFLYNGITSFKNNKYDQALEDFKNYRESNSTIDTSMFLYKGVTHIYLNQPDEAVVAFDLVANSQLLIKSRGLWFKALGYLKNNEIEKTKGVLSIIIKNPENFNYKQAKKLLDDL